MPLDFQRDVLDRSHRLPVVVDFWAAWCGPCRVLGPVLEDLASRAAGRWELVKVDTEAHPDLAQQYGILSIPAVKMFRDGRVAAEFVGALPGHEVERWLQANLPDPRRTALGSIARRWEAEGPAVAADLEVLLADHPGFAAAQLLLALAVLPDDTVRARRLLDDAQPEVEDADLAEDVAALVDLMTFDGEFRERAREPLEAARDAFRAHDLDRTLDALVDVAMVDRHSGDELARRAAVALFRRLGRDHPLTRDHERRLSMALHS